MIEQWYFFSDASGVWHWRYEKAGYTLTNAGPGFANMADAETDAQTRGYDPLTSYGWKEQRPGQNPMWR